MKVSELEQLHQNGTYAALMLSSQSQKQLADWLDQHNIVHDDPAEFHCTVLYSKNPLPQAESIAGTINISATIKKWELLGDHATVFLINCDKAVQLHQLFIKHGGHHSWPTYIPHVTINSEKHLLDLPKDLPNFTLYFNQITVSPIIDY